MKDLEIMSEKRRLTELGYLAWWREGLGGAWGRCSPIFEKLSSGRDWAHPGNPRELGQIGLIKECVRGHR